MSISRRIQVFWNKEFGVAAFSFYVQFPIEQVPLS